jgi:Cu/Ag efflux protein CusF
MKRILLPAVLAVSLAATGLAMAAPSAASGTIKAIDHTAMTLTLSDGTVYALPKGFDASKLKVGEKVSVAWQMYEGKHEATAVTPAS